MGLNKSHLTESVEDFRERLSHSDALPQLVSLGVISGILAALIIVGFRWLFETPLLMAMGDSEGFGSLTRPARFLLPCLGAIDSLASLHEASNRLRSAEAEALVVVPVIKSEAKPVLGVITKTNILNYYGM